MKYCMKCGAANADSAKFCTECGAALAISETNTIDTNSAETTSAETSMNYTYEAVDSKVTPSSETDKYSYTYDANNSTHTGYSTVHPGIAPRSIVVAIILSIVTCGIYQLYWMFKMNEEVNVLASEPNATSGGLVILFHFITCGIYGIYWSYKMGERCDRIKSSVDGSSALLYLILTIFGFGIVAFCLIQDTLNKAV